MMLNIAIIGATGMVGEKIREVLDERFDKIDHIYFLASARSAGNTINFKGKDYIIEELTPEVFEGKDIQYALFAAGGSISEKFIPIANKAGITVIDNSSHFRMFEDVPLIVPEVNEQDIKEDAKLIANPNCSTIQSMLPLKVIHNLFGLKRVAYTTYQAVSGAGVGGVSDLVNKEVKQFSRPIYNNVLPQIDVFDEDGYTKEELKMIYETRKILNLPNLPVTATAVRVPVENSHSISMNIECERPIDLELLNKTLKASPGIKVIDLPDYPIAEDANGTDDVYVGRIRLDKSLENGLNLWCVADNIRKGAATNTVQILESMIKLRA
ncbi:MAG: aspartate-semialdehyde dehydrogenase [Erysipelothrix sp.]|nr:aspartate-semialdehyde dehydrogenase [Erysipelothrix sp.]